MGLQAMANMGVVTALLPNKGLPLPFISYGGSNLMLCMLCVGFLFNLQRQGVCGNNRDEEPGRLSGLSAPRAATVRM